MFYTIRIASCEHCFNHLLQRVEIQRPRLRENYAFDTLPKREAILFCLELNSKGYPEFQSGPAKITIHSSGIY